MRFEKTPLLRMNPETGAITADADFIVRIPVSDDPSDPERAVATLYMAARPDHLVATMAMVRLPAPISGRAVYVIADEAGRYRPATALEGTVNAFVNAVMSRN